MSQTGAGLSSKSTGSDSLASGSNTEKIRSFRSRPS
jgi:hypothetical protein